MSVDENKIVSGSKLSAEVEPFIPSQFRNGLDQNNVALNPTVLQQLPSYMTNCYPFVQETTRPLVTRWQPQPHPQYIVPPLSVPPPPPPPPQTNLVSMFDICNPGTNQNFQYKPQRRGLQYPTMAPYPMTLNTNHYYSVQPFQGTHVPYQYTTDSQSNILKHQPKTDRISFQKNKSIKEVSEVKQNLHTEVKPNLRIEAGNGPSSSSEQKKSKNVTTNFSQTDFSETIADLTLAEKPSSLFKNVKLKNDFLNGVEDSESDSGYSSPLNRKNLTNVTIKKNSAGSEFNSLSTSVSKSDCNSIPKDFSPVLVCSTTSSLKRTPKTHHEKISNTSDNVKHSTPPPRNPSQDRDNRGTTNNPSKLGLNSRQTPQYKAQAAGGPQKETNRYMHSESNLSIKNASSKRNRNSQRHNSKCENENASSYPGLLFLNNSSPKSLEPVILKLEDEKEYPQLESSKHTPAFPPKHQRTVFSYSDALKRKNIASPVFNVSVKDPVDEPVEETTPFESNNSLENEDKARSNNNNNNRWRKPLEIKRDIQSIPVETNKRRATVKSKTPLQFNFSDLLAVLKKQQEKQAEEKETRKVPSKLKDIRVKINKSANPLDSAPPSKLRGKEKENPAKKRPSALKKVILKEREERKQLRNVQEKILGVGISLTSQPSTTGSGDASENCQIDIPSPKSAEMSPVSQLSPISISPVSPGGSPMSSEGNSPVAGIPGSQDTLKMKLHSRRFREYCNQMLDKEIDASCTALLQDLVRFQDRLYHKDPIKAKSKRRLVLGLREVTKHLKLRKLKCIIISPNLERIQSKGGLDDALSNIIKIAQDQNIPFVFALGRRALGQACSKLVPVSCVGVFNYEGSEANFKLMIDSSEKAREAYQNMVAMLENVSPEATTKQLFAHLGHSRTPSASSAISFASSITSENVKDIGAGNLNKPEKQITNGPEINTTCDNKKWEDSKENQITNKSLIENSKSLLSSPQKSKVNKKRIAKWIVNTLNC